MASEDKIDIPERWRHVVHPRRRGMIGLDPVRDRGWNLLGRPAQHAAGRAGLAAEHEQILDQSHLDPALAELVRSGDPSVGADAVRLALAQSTAWDASSRSWSVVAVDELVADRGLVHAAAAFVQSCAYYLVRVPSGDGPALSFPAHPEVDGSWASGLLTGGARLLRSMLAVAPQELYDEAVTTLTPLRGGLPRQRLVLSYLMPDLREWVSADLADLPAIDGRLSKLLFFSAATAGQLSRFTVSSLEGFVTAYDAIGPEAAPLIAQWLAQWQWSPDARRDALDVLTRILRMRRSTACSGCSMYPV